MFSLSLEMRNVILFRDRWLKNCELENLMYGIMSVVKLSTAVAEEDLMSFLKHVWVDEIYGNKKGDEKY